MSDASSLGITNRTHSSLSNTSRTPSDSLQSNMISYTTNKASTISDWVTFDDVKTSHNQRASYDFDMNRPPEVPCRKFSSNSVNANQASVDLLSMDNDTLSEHLSEKSFEMSDSKVPPIPDRLMSITTSSPHRNQLSPSPFDIRIPPPNASKMIASPMGSLKRRSTSSRSQSSSSASSVYMSSSATANVPPVPPRSLDKLVGDYVSFKTSINDLNADIVATNELPLLSNQLFRSNSDDCSSGDFMFFILMFYYYFITI